MGIVKISDELHEAAKQVGKAMNRSINAQAEHWMRIGRLIEENPNLTYWKVREIFIQAAAAEQYADINENAG